MTGGATAGIAWTIVKDHGGEPGVHSPDGLVIFTVTLPLHPA
jgi:nitrogen-specific signal transduction histidine kinase